MDFRPQNPVLCSAMLPCDHVLQTSGPTKKPSTCTIHKSVFFQQLRQWRKARKPINRAHPNCKMGVAISTSKELIPNPQHSDIPKFGYWKLSQDHKITSKQDCFAALPTEIESGSTKTTIWMPGICQSSPLKKNYINITSFHDFSKWLVSFSFHSWHNPHPTTPLRPWT